MTADTEHALCPRLLEALAGVSVAPDRAQADVSGRLVEAERPSELRGALSTALYNTLHSSGPSGEDERPYTLRDPELDRMFADALPHRTTLDEVVLADSAGVPSPAPGQVLVLRGGVRVWADTSDLVEGADGPPGTRAVLRVPAGRPAVSPGFFLASGSTPVEGQPRLRLYAHFRDPASAYPAWESVLEAMEARGTGYLAKVLSSHALYPRRDALVVYLTEGFDEVPALLAERLTGLPGLRPDTSVFARELAPGLALAWEPDDSRPRMRGLSFGQHRASVTARALIREATEDVALDRALVEEYTAAGIDPTAPFRNLDSP
ncbi:T3SS effector HopA1 family protein [Streptomonospora wellingtoniae]|uniref:T3SS effector HopA1 family protein n=1 Tax=Streptomonospora wellingtoniae TaxID=3075544 RepID=A0ABU2KP48_9ACTN|nr:T3SS effector HopA1 family protein [Streptomonospora sp. DSM 45055]MDT0300943.1 T3SS effector HopA1 family protein [Streptomonospora sp. DSM 45055]